jgi:radical SAM protein (TIGR01212 family)
MPVLPYRTLSSFLRAQFHKRVQKITLDAGLSCPHRDSDRLGGCIYCNMKGSGTGALAQGIALKDQIESQMRIMAGRYGAEGFIAYFQSFSNTYAPLETLRSIYDTILPFPEIVGLAIGTRPDCIDEEKLDLIGSYADGRLVWIEYGLQSASNKTLKLINRGHTVEDFVDAVKLTANYPFRQCAHVIIGLPGEGMDQYIKTARLISSLPITDIKIHLLYVTRGTPMEELFFKGKYTPLTLDEYADAVANFIAHVREDIVIQRITGDPHADELIEPKWAVEKGKVRSSIHQALASLGLTQGCMT